MRITVSPPVQVGNLFTVTVSGELQSDNLVHWYTVASGTSPISNLQLTGKLLFSGSLTYDSTGDTGTDGVDFYAGTVNLSAEVICGARFVATTGADSFPGPALNSCRVAGTPCKTVQHAVDVACPGDTVNVAAGTFPEQVTVQRAVTLVGAGAGSTFIQAPGTMAHNTSVVTVDGAGTNVSMTGFTVAGPGPGGCGQHPRRHRGPERRQRHHQSGRGEGHS